jgi:hypothetical protein
LTDTKASLAAVVAREASEAVARAASASQQQAQQQAWAGAAESRLAVAQAAAARAAEDAAEAAAARDEQGSCTTDVDAGRLQTLQRAAAGDPREHERAQPQAKRERGAQLNNKRHWWQRLWRRGSAAPPR